MTRKRFVKILMGRFGYCRDLANAIAFSIRRNGGAYKDEFLLNRYIVKGVVK